MASIKTNLSKSYIESLVPAEDGLRHYFYDLKVPGLELCMQPTGAKSFAVRRWIKNKSHRVVLGRYDGDAMQPYGFESDPLQVMGKNPALTIEQARRLAQAVLAELSRGDKPWQIRRKEPEKREMTLGELFRVYIDNYAMEHTKTWKVMEECFARYLSDWSDKPLSELTRGDLQLLVNKLGKNNGKATANRTLELVRAIINKGKHWGLFTGDNPASGVTKFKLKPRERFVGQLEIPKLMKSINEETNTTIRDYVLMSLSTGARKSNVLGMRWDQLDMEQGAWMIPDTKNGTSQTILLTAEELEILRSRFDHRRSFEWVFPGPDPNKHLCDPKKGWYRILERAGIKDLHLHDLRRTLGSYMAMSGASLSVIGNALNHKDVSTTRKVYAQSAKEAEKLARERAHDMMFNPERQAAEEALRKIRQIEF